MKSKLEDLVNSYYESLFLIDREGKIYDYPTAMMEFISPHIVDETTLSAVDIQDLFNVVNKTQTRIGSATLFRSLMEPIDSKEYIIEKQNSLIELKKTTRLENI